MDIIFLGGGGGVCRLGEKVAFHVKYVVCDFHQLSHFTFDITERVIYLLIVDEM